MSCATYWRVSLHWRCTDISWGSTMGHSTGYHPRSLGWANLHANNHWQPRSPPGINPFATQAATRSPEAPPGSNPFEAASRAFGTTTATTPIHRMSEYKFDHKRVQYVVKLDFDTDVKMFSHWEIQAEDYLPAGNPEVMQLLSYAAESGIPITKDVERTMATPQLNAPDISGQIYSGFIYITTGSTMRRLVTEAGKWNGLEIWQLIYREWKNKSPHVMSTYRATYEQATTC